MINSPSPGQIEDPQPEIPDTMELRGEVEQIRACVDQCEIRQQQIQEQARVFIENGNGDGDTKPESARTSLET